MGLWHPRLASPVSLERATFYYIGKRVLSGEIYTVSGEIYTVSGELYEVSGELYAITGCRCL